MARFSWRVPTVTLHLCLPLLKAQVEILGKSSALPPSTWTADTRYLFIPETWKRCPGICQSSASERQPTGQLFTAKWRSWWQALPGTLRNQLVRRVWVRGPWMASGICPYGKSHKYTRRHSNPGPLVPQKLWASFLSLSSLSIYHVLTVSHLPTAENR